MKAPARPKTDFEKVAIGEMLPGIIEAVEYDQEHKFKGFSGAEDTVQPAIRLKFKLDGYKFPHFTRWMKFSMHEKSNLFNKYVVKLVENATPDMDIDMDILNNMRIKTVWAEKGDFQNLESIFPIGKKIIVTTPLPTVDLDAPPIAEEDAEALPF